MKVTYRIPTEQYGYIEVELPTTEEQLPASYEEVKAMFEPVVEPAIEYKAGLPELEFNKVLDKYIATHSMLAEEYESLDERQKNIIQCLKRHFKRTRNGMG